MQECNRRRWQDTEPVARSEAHTPNQLPAGGSSSPLNEGTALAIGVLAACAFARLATINLSAQGVYYDEIHQAPAAFACLGKKAPFFAMSFVHRIPLMTMTYSGAIKPILYGLYLRFTGASFSVESWRWLGIGVGGSHVSALLHAGPQTTVKCGASDLLRADIDRRHGGARNTP